MIEGHERTPRKARPEQRCRHQVVSHDHCRVDAQRMRGDPPGLCYQPRGEEGKGNLQLFLSDRMRQLNCIPECLGGWVQPQHIRTLGGNDFRQAHRCTHWRRPGRRKGDAHMHEGEACGMPACAQLCADCPERTRVSYCGMCGKKNVGERNGGASSFVLDSLRAMIGRHGFSDFMGRKRRSCGALLRVYSTMHLLVVKWQNLKRGSDPGR